MSKDDEQAVWWRAAGNRHGIEVVSPCSLTLSNGVTIKIAALVKVGPPMGMAVDPVWSTLAPHADQLAKDGYGYSVVEIDNDDISEMLRDWVQG